MYRRLFVFVNSFHARNVREKPTKQQNPRLTSGSSAVYPRLISGTKSALRSWLLTSVPTPICLCKPFSCKACPGISLVRPSGETFKRRVFDAFPAHALHEKGLQRQIGVGTLVSSQERRTLFRPGDKPRMNRWSTADFVPPSVYIGFRLFVLLGRR